MSQIGLIYILKHSSGTTVKVGETIRDPQDRLNEYRKAYDLKNFSFYKSFEVPANARQDVERIAHQILQQYQLSGLGGAREIFSCAPDLAERAVRDAIQKSTVARVEKERQQKIADETERKRLVEQRHREEVKKLEAHAELEWSKKPSTIELKRQLQNFLDNNPLTKEEPKKLGLWGYLAASLGTIWFFGGLWSITIDEPSLTLTYPALVFGCALITYKSWNGPQEQVPDEDAISRKQSLENEIAKSKKTYVRQKLM